MDFGLEAGIFLAYTAGVMIVYFFGKMLILPLKVLLKFIFNSIVGGVILVMINFVGATINISLPVNIITAAITGVLGIPGILALLIYFNIF